MSTEALDPNTPNLRRKLLAVMQEIGGIPKNGKAPAGQGGYEYQQAADIFPKVQRALIEHGVMFLAHEVSRTQHPTHQSKGGGLVFVEDVAMKYTFLDTDTDERIEGHGSGVAFDNSDKALNKAKTAALKYFFKQTFLIGEKDDDPEAHDTGEVLEPFFDDAREDLEAHFQGSMDSKVTDAQALSITQWCRAFGVDFRAVFGETFGVEIPEQMTDPQYAIWLEKRDGILQERQREVYRVTGTSKDIEAANKIVNATAARVQQQSAPQGVNYISEKQAHRFFAKAGGNKDLMRQVLDQFSIKSDREIPRALYDQIIAEVEKTVAPF